MPMPLRVLCWLVLLMRSREMGVWRWRQPHRASYNIALCDFNPAEDNYEEFLNWKSSRQARHDGNLDIIYNHSGVLDMIADLSWSGADAYSRADQRQTEDRRR